MKRVKKVSSITWTWSLFIATMHSVLCTPYNSIQKENRFMTEKVQAVVLAAGKSSRFKTGKTKLIEKICGQEMILFTTKLLSRLNIPTTLVVGYQKEALEEVVNAEHPHTIDFIFQAEQKGTGHAVKITQDGWNKEHILILNADMPLITDAIIVDLIEKHKSTDADFSFVTAQISGIEHSYGRVIHSPEGISIIEAKDFEGDVHEQCTINAGIYIAKTSFLRDSINLLDQKNKSGEFYITDLVKIASNQHKKVSTTIAPFDLVRGVNTLQELWAAEQIKRSEVIKKYMDQGVRFSVAQNVHIDLDVTIGSGSYIGCGVHLQHGTHIGKNCIIHENVSLDHAILGDNCVIYPFTIVTDSTIDNNAQVGPFAHIREHTHLGQGSSIGNFVEVKQTTVGHNSKAKHLAYLGNAVIGSRVNIGAGTITCNYNGVSKHTTVIDNNSFIGSNCTLVAPVHIGEQAFTAAGSVITQDVPENALALGRSRQVNKAGYATKLRDSHHTQAYDTQEDEIRFAGAIKTMNDNNV